MFTYPAALGCLIVSKLLVLYRMKDFAESQALRWIQYGRILVVIIAACSVAGMVGNVMAGVSFMKASVLYAEYANDNVTATYNSALQARFDGIQRSAVNLVCELLMLFFTIVAFLVVGFFSSREIAEAMLMLQSSNARMTNTDSLKEVQKQVVGSARHLRRRVIFTAGFMFISFLLRMVYTLMFSVANGLSNSDLICEGFTDRCSSCYNQFTHMQIWMLYNPGNLHHPPLSSLPRLTPSAEFQFAIIIIAQNIALLVAIWGITSGNIMTLMQSKGQDHELSEHRTDSDSVAFSFE